MVTADWPCSSNETLSESMARRNTIFIEGLENIDDFSNFSAIGKVESIHMENGHMSKEIRYFILSFIATVSHFAQCVSGHCSIENFPHWVLDVAFREEQSRIRRDNMPSNMSTIRQVSINMIKQEKTEKIGVEMKRRIAVCDSKYL